MDAIDINDDIGIKVSELHDFLNSILRPVRNIERKRKKK